MQALRSVHSSYHIAHSSIKNECRTQTHLKPHHPSLSPPNTPYFIPYLFPTFRIELPSNFSKKITTEIRYSMDSMTISHCHPY